jgi:hypothetical protein
MGRKFKGRLTRSQNQRQPFPGMIRFMNSSNMGAVTCGI